ncbi:hypothetical protein ACFSDD_11015 [Salipiger marinus]|uniref:hypothetical protein n=1 Tax=Salipiger marinus TaxID=555512 RepID=UPI002BE3145E|nr:hypothetical protein [Salipiger manganoxidans]MEB3419901.1 hypothetical protein [Salipiger manganoxidans]
MALRLPKRELPAVEFRCVLPEAFGPGGECFIEIDARAAGAINAPFVAAIERAMQQHRIGMRKLGKLEDDAAYVEADAKLAAESTRNRLLAIYDHCVIAWRSNIQVLDERDNVVPITCDRDSFAELAEMRGVPEIAKALAKFEAACVDAGKLQAEDDEATVKN